MPFQSPSAIDHLVVAAPSLETGAQYIRETLGVELEAGGVHARMGTHNRLLKLGAALYLEVIAIDPQAAAPARARWFELDSPRSGSPHLATWVVRTADIAAAASRSPIPLGTIETMTRGELSWRITMREDGGLPCDGVMPALIEWRTPRHPAASLSDRGCRLLRLQARHANADQIRSALGDLGVDEAIAIAIERAAPGERPSLSATIDTRAGPRTLG